MDFGNSHRGCSLCFFPHVVRFVRFCFSPRRSPRYCGISVQHPFA
uniref:Uncharacterized protein n=1 Tax=Microviridae sp. ctX0F7 TaxID=2824999 RepID=A0A8S5NYX5_9VIRU|nr:MAG TPA: hypothetical protein [Microviridae sp. ctX0F7]